MEILKNCPFCGTPPKVSYDSASGKYIMQCLKCKSKNIIVSISGDSIEDLTPLWNDRFFDNQLLNNKEEFLKFIDCYYYNKDLKENKVAVDPIMEKKVQEIKTVFSFNKNYGHLIFDDGSVESCEIYSHPEVLLERFGIYNYTDTSFDHSEFCRNNGIIKITCNNGELAINIPLTYYKKQIDILFKILTTAEYVNDMCRFALLVFKENRYDLFYSINELLQAIDKLDKGA